jgi:hypothetical protein
MSEVEAKGLEPGDEFDEPTIVLESTDNVGDVSVEINVEALLHDLEVDGLLSAGGQGPEAARRKLEEIMERKRAARELEDFDDYDV